ncbi:MAG: biliverdin-producing heme oxygenase [Phycisphaerales bacterium]
MPVTLGLETNLASPVMSRLRDETAALHKLAETKPFQVAMVRGLISRDQYTRWLGQMWTMHRELDTALRSASERAEPIRQVVTPEQYQEPYLRQDLSHFGVAPETVAASPGTAAFIERVRAIAAASPLDTLGVHYVLEGSKNGNRFIVRAVRKSLGLTPGQGDRYLDTYGEAQPAKWAAFKTAMGRIPFTPREIDGLVAAAKAAFEGVIAMSDDMNT